MPFRFLSPYFHSVAEPIEAYFFWYLDRLPKAKSGKKKLGKKSSEKKVWHFYSEFSMTALRGEADPIEDQRRVYERDQIGFIPK